jgi:hypothetical protein
MNIHQTKKLYSDIVRLPEQLSEGTDQRMNNKVKHPPVETTIYYF